VGLTRISPRARFAKSANERGLSSEPLRNALRAMNQRVDLASGWRSVEGERTRDGGGTSKRAVMRRTRTTRTTIITRKTVPIPKEDARVKDDPHAKKTARPSFSAIYAAFASPDKTGEEP